MEGERQVQFDFVECKVFLEHLNINTVGSDMPHT